MASTYAELLKHPLWQRKRLEILQRDEFMCQRCYDDETTLHIHHRQYIKGRKPWEYEDSNFVTLCAICHEDVTQTSDRIKQLLAKVNPDFLSDVESLLEAAVSGPSGGLRAWELTALSAGFLVGSGAEGDTPWIETMLQKNPVLFHRGLLAGIVSQDQHHDGQAARDMEHLAKEVLAAAPAWEFLARTIAMIEALDKVPPSERERSQYVMKAARESLPPRKDSGSAR